MTTAAPTGALLGYARVSTDRQVLDQQLDALRSAGVNPERIWTEKMSGKRDDRPQLAAMLAYARPGDTIVVWRIDRLGRSLSHIVKTIEELTEDGIHVRAIHDGADSSTSTGRMMIGLLATMAQYERDLIAERSAAARQARAARGKPVGRPAALTADQARQVRALHDGGESVPSLVASFKVSRATIYRALSDQPQDSC